MGPRLFFIRRARIGRELLRTGGRLAKHGSTARLLPTSLPLPRREAPPLGYFAETPRAAKLLTFGHAERMGDLRLIRLQFE